MKRRFVSLFFVLLMLPVVTQPTFVMHYCGGRLYEVGLLKQAMSTCCGDDSVASVPILKGKCCSVSELVLNTDDFSGQAQVQVPEQAQTAFHIDFVGLKTAFLRVLEPSAVLYFTPPDFTPFAGGLCAFLCVFRI